MTRARFSYLPAGLALMLFLLSFPLGAQPHHPWGMGVWEPDVRLGVTVRQVPFDDLAAAQLEYGLRVLGVEAGSPAHRAGLRPGDILLALDDKPAYSVDRLRWLARQARGAKVPLRYVRDGAISTVDINLGASDRPVPPPGRASGPSSGGAYLGVEVQAMTEDLREHFGTPKDAGVLVVRVAAETPAAEAGFAVGDAIVRLEGKRVRRVEDIHRALDFFDPGDQVEIELVRDKASKVVTVTLGESPAADAAPQPRPWYPPIEVPDPRYWIEPLEEMIQEWERRWQEKHPSPGSGDPARGQL